MLIITKLILIMSNLKTINILILFLITTIQSQDLKASIEIFNQKNNPNIWWMNNNNNGKLPSNSGVEIFFSYKKNKQSLKFKLSNQYDVKNSIKFSESFFKYQLSSQTFLKVGRYYKDFSKYLNEDLSTGSLIVSKNARPFKKIGLVSEYPMKKINLHFGILHGQLKKNAIYQKAPNVHEKFFYIDFKRKNEVFFSAGLVHSTLWAGATYEYGDFPNEFSDFLKIFISADGPQDGGPHANALGSHIGIWDFVYFKQLNKKFLAKMYYQHFFEDTSSFRFANEIDGLWGFEINSIENDISFLVEYLDTTHSDLNPPYQADTYYWNYQYQDGWRYRDKIIGNPFINPDSGPRGVYGHYQYKILHLGTKLSLLDDYKLNIKISKIINTSSDIYHSISLSKYFKEKYQISFFNFGNGKDMAPKISLTYYLN